MGEKIDKENKTGKLLTRVILNSGVKCGSGKIMIKAETGNDAFIPVFFHIGGEIVESNFRKLKAIFTPNFDKAFHIDVLKAQVISAIEEACEMLSITKITLKNNRAASYHSLFELFISINGNVVEWRPKNTELPILYIPKEKQENILNCIEHHAGTHQIVTPKQNILTFKFDKNKSEIVGSSGRWNIDTYVNIGIKDVKINHEEISFVDMVESGLITALKEEFLEEDDLIRYDAEHCAVTVLDEDLDLKSIANSDIYLSCYVYLISVNGKNVDSFREYGDKNINDIIDEIAEKNGW